jgi:TonB family protein
VVESVSPSLDHEAIRIIKKTLWTPAYRLGKPVSASTTYTIKFNIKKYNKHCKKRGYEEPDYPVQPVDTSNIVYTREEVDKMPKAVFDEAHMNIQQYIHKNLKYPDPAFRQNISGTVKLAFVVEPRGRISHLVTVKPLAGGCSEEARRIVKELKWMPGMKNGKAVRTQLSIDITFKLPEKQEMH